MKLGRAIMTSLILSLLMVLVCFAENSTGWPGYGLYDLNHSKISIAEEKTVININRNAVTQTSEYILKNDTDKDINASIGIPDDHIAKLQVYDNGIKKILKGKTQKYLTEQLGDGSSLPEAKYYYVFSVLVKKGETKTLQVNIDATLTKDSQGSYTFIYLSDANGANTIKRGTAKVEINLGAYKPYDIISMDGLSTDQFGENGKAMLDYANGDMKTVTIKYQDLDRSMLEPLQKSGYKAPKAITAAFISKDFAKAEKLCDSYISRPVDKKLALEQVKLVKAECLRYQVKYDDYLNLVNSLDNAKLYPENIKYKLLFDQINVYKIQNKQDEQNKTTEALLGLSKDSRTYLFTWLNANGFGAVSNPTAAPTATVAPEKKSQKGGISRLFAGFKSDFGKGLKAVIGYVITFLAGLGLGILLNKRKSTKRRSMYSYRR